MRYFYIILYLFFIALSVSAQSYDKVMATDKITVTSMDQTVTAYTYPVKKKVNAVSDKLYYWYSANQINITQGGYSGRLLNGPYAAFYTNKNLKEQGEFKKGLQHGEWKSWYENGQLKEVLQWQSGVKDGHFEEYNEQGIVSRSGKYSSGLLQGKVTSYKGKDSIQVVRYNDGKPVVNLEKKVKKSILPKWRVKSKVNGFFNRIFKKKDKSKTVISESSRKKQKKEITTLKQEVAALKK